MTVILPADLADLMAEFPDAEIQVRVDPPVILAILRPTPTASRTIADHTVEGLRAKLRAVR